MRESAGFIVYKKFGYLYGGIGIHICNDLNVVDLGRTNIITFFLVTA